MDIRPCNNCGDKFVYSHEDYRPRVIYKPEGIQVFCSDACKFGVLKNIQAACGCDMRTLSLTDGKDGRKWVCVSHSEVQEYKIL